MVLSPSEKGGPQGELPDQNLKNQIYLESHS